MSRRRSFQSVAVPVPLMLMRSLLSFIPLVPAECRQGDGFTLVNLIAARDLREVARVRFRELTGAGHASWRVYPQNVAPAIRKAGIKLGEELAQR